MRFNLLIFCLSAVSVVVIIFQDFFCDRFLTSSRNLKATQLKNEMLPKVEAILYNEEYSLWGRINDSYIGDDLMSRAVHPGNPALLRKVLRKVLRGENITIAVMGGSNSAGGNLGADEKSLDGLYFKVFIDWWKKTIAQVTKSFVIELQRAIGATGSYFYAYCFKTLLAEGEKIDIVLIEVSVNDGNEVMPLEQLTRQLLKYPSKPALLYVNFVRGVHAGNISCINLESFGQVELAGYYGIASLSLREILCRKENGNWKAVITGMMSSDGNHVDGRAHALVAMLMIRYVESIFKDLIKDLSKGVAEETAPEGIDLPKFLFVKRETEALEKPLCWTGKTPNVNNSLHQTNLQFNVINRKGFSSCVIPKSNTKWLRPDGDGGWCARNDGSTLKVSIFVPSLDRVDSRSVTVMILNRGGQAVVWLDNEKNKAAKFDQNFGYDQFKTVGRRLSPGYHDLTIKTVCEGLLMVTGIFVGPPDFNLSF